MKIAVLLSGGVDSSVALRLVKQQGHRDVCAFYLKIWLEDELAYLGSCPWEEDLKYARAVCEQAGIPLQVISLQTEYQERVVAEALAELRAGRTPSPDIWCNQRIKFGLFFEKIDAGFDRIISGHYAQVEEQGDACLLKRSPDSVKDQTYFLCTLNQSQLRRLWFPIGHLRKDDVRRLAREFDLPNRDRKDSQGICFLGKIRYPEFVRHHLGERAGEIVELETGKTLSEHRGFWFYTIGQRKGIGLAGGPWYVVKKDVTANRVYVSHSDHYLNHARRQFTVSSVNWITGEPQRLNLQAKVRHGPRLADCRVGCLGEGRWEVTLAGADQGIASGQSAVFYDGEICLGGGVIE
ncbi:MAG TPA: tRNA 2-thiouridine(34) synthase MnmA [Candidatus Angelobacter sp.]|nr:tRNA 2-thiouridine(34) synthase MnmA [Candidatus Angelobacter sp.]